MYRIPSLRLVVNFKDSSLDCSPRWVDTTIHQLEYSRQRGDEGKRIRQALFRFFKYALSHLLCITRSHVNRPADGTARDLGNPSTSTGTNASWSRVSLLIRRVNPDLKALASSWP